MNINEEVQKIKVFLQSGAPADPMLLAQYHRVLGGTYAFIAEEFSGLENKKNMEVEFNRENTKSDKQAERMFLSTEYGRAYVRCKYQLKAIGKMMSSINKSIENARVEFSGQKYN